VPSAGLWSPVGSRWFTPAEKKACPRGVTSHHTPPICSARNRPVALVPMPVHPPNSSKRCSACSIRRNPRARSLAVSVVQSAVIAKRRRTAPSNPAHAGHCARTRVTPRSPVRTTIGATLAQTPGIATHRSLTSMARAGAASPATTT
jgi:hypothetical protein